MSQIAAAQAVLDAFNVYLAARSDFGRVGSDMLFTEDCADACILAEADLHLSHNLQKMLNDDQRMASIRKRLWNVRGRDQKRAEQEERIRAIVREVLAEVQKP